MPVLTELLTLLLATRLRGHDIYCGRGFGRAARNLTIIAGLPELAPETLWYFAGTVALCLIAKLIDQLGNGPLPDGAPWPGSIEASSPT